MVIHPKVTAMAFAGALVGIIVTELNRRGIAIDASEGSDLTLIVATIAGIWMPNGTSPPDGNGAQTPALPPVVVRPAPPPIAQPPAAPPAAAPPAQG